MSFLLSCAGTICGISFVHHSRVIKKFLSDSAELKCLIDFSNEMDAFELKDQARGILVVDALAMFEREAASCVPNDECREKFKYDHAIFLKFDLVDAEWGQYFREARRRFDAKQAADAAGALEGKVPSSEAVIPAASPA